MNLITKIYYLIIFICCLAFAENLHSQALTSLTSFGQQKRIASDPNKERGFVLFIDPDYWYYVPAAELDSEENYLAHFNSDNLSYGSQFRPFFKKQKSDYAES